MIESNPKLMISIRPPLPNHKPLHSPRSPTLLSPAPQPFVRKTSNNKSIHRPSLEKSKQQAEFEKVIKYSKSPKPQAKEQSSLIESEHTFAGSVHHLDDSRETVPRTNTLSRDSKTASNRRRQPSGERAGLKLFDSVDSNNGSKRCPQKNEQYYLYWKNKAHQYLQSNIKLMEQINKLNRENEELKQTVSRLTLREDENRAKVQVKEQDSPLALREISLHYLNKIESMEKEMKRKELVVQSFQIKFKEMNQALSGDQERIKLISRLRAQIQQLKAEKISKSPEINIISPPYSPPHPSHKYQNTDKFKQKPQYPK